MDHIVALTTLLEAGADVNTSTNEGKTTLMMASKQGSLKCLGHALGSRSSCEQS